jgi:hypothetical protein
MPPKNYIETVPENIDKSQEEWEKLNYHTQYYHANENRQEQMRENQKTRRQRKKEWLRTIKTERGCVNCGEDDARCLDFHHTGKKSETLSNMASNDASKERMRKEIEECVVMCANCHRKEHRKI